MMSGRSITSKTCTAAGGEFGECDPMGCLECRYSKNLSLEQYLKIWEDNGL